MQIKKKRLDGSDPGGPPANPAAKPAKRATPAKPKAPAKARKATKPKAHDPVESLVKQSKRDVAYQEETHPGYPYVVKDDYLQVTINGKPFSLDSSHPTFKRMRKALLDANWKAVPRLVNLAQSLLDAGEGDVAVKGGVVYYKGQPVHSTLTQRIVDMIKEAQEVKFMLRFMDNLYQNPSPKAKDEFYDWLGNNKLPITDDGYFLAYKSVNADLRDTWSNTVDNTPGVVIRGSRKWFDEDYDRQCSKGYHLCSKQYGVYGARVLCVKASPADVLGAVGGKMRVVGYEVLCELTNGAIIDPNDKEQFKAHGFSQLEGKMVVEVKAERKELLTALLADRAVKRLIKQGRLTEASFTKSSYARLKVLAQRYKVIEIESGGPEPVTTLTSVRVHHGLSRGQLAKQLEKPLKYVVELEKLARPPVGAMDRYMEAVAELTGKDIKRGISWPKVGKPAMEAV